jgi:acyl carrier protein
MSESVQCMTFSELKEIVERLEKEEKVTNETKIMLDTGWDSLQEILPGTISIQEAQTFKVQDELTKEFFGGYVLKEKSDKFDTDESVETVIVIENRY